MCPRRQVLTNNEQCFQWMIINFCSINNISVDKMRRISFPARQINMMYEYKCSKSGEGRERTITRKLKIIVSFDSTCIRDITLIRVWRHYWSCHKIIAKRHSRIVIMSEIHMWCSEIFRIFSYTSMYYTQTYFAFQIQT